jgi:hypothetical protein
MAFAHVGEAGDVGEGALEAEAEAGMRHRAVAAQIAVPGVVLAADPALGHIAVQYFEPLLALLPSMISPIPGASTSIAATVRLPSVFDASSSPIPAFGVLRQQSIHDFRSVTEARCLQSGESVREVDHPTPRTQVQYS